MTKLWILGTAICLTWAPACFARDATREISRCGGDDTGAVQRALNDLPDGGTLLISCQAAIDGRGITLQGKEHVTIQGEKGGGFRALSSTRQSIPGFGSVMFVIKECNSCTVRDLTIDGANVGVAALGFDMCVATNVLNNTISNAGPPPASGAIVATANQHNRYVGNTIIHTNGTGPGGNGTRGIWLGNVDERAIEWYPYVADNTIRDTAHTGLVLHTVAAEARNNLIEGMGDGAGIKTIPAAGKPGITRIEHNTIRNGRAENQGIQLQDAYSDGLIIQDNILEGLADSGVYGNGGNVQVIGNTFRDDRTAGITILEGRDWVIRENTFTHAPSGGVLPGTGIRLTTDSGVIQNIQIVSNDIGRNLHGGIQLHDSGGTIRGVKISNNTIADGESYGLLIDQRSPDAIADVEAVNNCFARNRSANLKDNRPGDRALRAVTGLPSCPPRPAAVERTVAAGRAKGS